MEAENIRRKLTHSKTFKEAVNELYKKQFENYHIVALMDLMMHFIATEEAFNDNQKMDILYNESRLNEIYKNVKDCIYHIKEYVSDPVKKDHYTDSLKEFKKELSAHVKVLIAYNDNIEIHESLLKKQVQHTCNYPTDEAYAGELLSFAFQDQDKFLINQRIKEIMRILPIRMTREKIYDYVSNSMQIYYGSYYNDLIAYVKDIKETILPESVDGYGLYFKDYVVGLNEIKAIKIENLNDDDASNYQKELEELSRALEIGLDICSSLTELINRLIILFIGPEIDFEALSKREPQMKSLYSILDHIEENDKINEVLLIESLTAVEGIPEKWHEKIQRMDSLVDIALYGKIQIQDRDALHHLNELAQSRRLMSTSLFADINEVDDSHEIQTDAGALETVINDLNGFIKEIMVTSEKVVRRQKINQLLYALPVAFKRPKDFYDFILLALQSCSRDEDKAYLWHEFQVLRDQYM